MTKNEALLGRKEAAEMLHISTRTLDRYVRSGKVHILRRKGKVFFRKEDLRSLFSGKEAETPHVVHHHASVAVREEERGNTQKYKILLDAAKAEIEEKNKMIMNIHHRVGYLEAELKNSVPLLESRTSQKDLEESISFLQKKLKNARVGKILFMVLFLLALFACFFLLLNTQLVLNIS